MYSSPKKIFRFDERFRYGYYQYADRVLGREKSFKLHEKRRRRFYAKLHKRLREGPPGETHEIQKISAGISSKEFKKKYVQPGIPVVIKGGAKEWRCCENWSIDYFKSLYGDEDVLFVDHEQIDSDYEELKLGEILDGIREGKGKYYRFYPLLRRHPEHIKDFDYEWLLKCRNNWKWNEGFQVFIGGKGSYTPMHNAAANNIFIQAHGEKDWYLYHPYYTPIFDPDPAQNVYRNGSYRQGGKVFNPFDPDFEMHPLYRYIDRVKVNLEEGDILYNPPYWWHAVQNPSDSIGVGYRWLAPYQAFKTAPTYFNLDLTVRNPPIWKWNKLAKEDVNLIHLAQTGRLDEYLESKKLKAS
jgi:hypothetical protein